MKDHVGAVAIGRNEGKRLLQCLTSLKRDLTHVVYVDSGSTDNSIVVARSLGVEVVELDMSRPFTAARARNEGAQRLKELGLSLGFLQFVDGDCELQPGWIDAALQHLVDNTDVAIVCGRRRERFPDATPYNRLCDLEWDTPVGETKACGGDFLVRLSAFDEVNGFDPGLIAGEEPDLCFRLRQPGWRIVRLPEEMTLHDAAMTRVGQWWHRAKRSGYADMAASRRRGAYEPDLRQRVWSNVLWSLPPAWLLWPLLWARVSRRRGPLYASHIVFGKPAHLSGILAYWYRHLRGAEAKLIEYK